MSTAALFVLLPGCSRSDPAAKAPAAASPAPPVVLGAKLAKAEPHAPSYDGGALEFINVTHEQLYPIFNVYRSMSQGERSGLWHQRYHHKWVRWTGKIKSFTNHGITLQMRPQTVTFDLSVWLEDGQMPTLRRDYKRGDVVTFIGRLSNYDDIFQKIYLTNGAVLEKPNPVPDMGF